MTAQPLLREAAEDFTPDQGELTRARGHDLHRVRSASGRRMRVLDALAGSIEPRELRVAE